MILKHKYEEEADDGTTGGSGGSSSDDSGNPSTDASLDDGGVKDTGQDGGKGAEDKGYWPEDWQARVSKGDEKLAKLAGRYASPEAAFEALVAAQNRIRSGELKNALPENPTPDQLKAWRKDNGVPDAPDKYDLKFDNGLVISDEDKPVIDEFLKAAHDNNLTESQAKAAIAWHYQNLEQQAEAREELDSTERQACLDELNVEWGKGFRRNVNAIESVLSRFPDDVREAFKSARLPDGTAVFNSPQVMRAFADLALELNPAGIVTPFDGDPMKGIDEEIKEIETLMRTNRKEYNRDEAKQERYRELLDAKSKMSQRKAG